jgi:alcohol dehydrogenase
MKAWRLNKLGGQLSLETIEKPTVRAGTVLVRIEASALMSYMKPYVEGKLAAYHAPPGPFTPGGNGIGIIEAVGPDVWHLKQGQRVVISSNLVTSENVAVPGQILLGVTAFGPVAEKIQADWPDGTLAEYTILPVETVTPIEGLKPLASTQLAVSMRYIVPYGGLLRGRLAAGETVVVTGATGAHGSAATLLAVAMGAAKVIACGRDEEALKALVHAGKGRVVFVILSGAIEADTAAIQKAAGSAIHLGFDMIGGATDPSATLAALRSLTPRGRLVLMGSIGAILPVTYMELMFNSWEIIGNFMYPNDAYRRLLDLVRAGLLDLGDVKPRVFPMRQLHEAMDAAAKAKGLECVVITPKG